MAQVKKSITRLLAERKSLEDRIRRATGVQFISIQKGTTNPQPVSYAGKTVQQVQELLKGNLNKVDGLIAYYRRITAAIIKSNAATNVTVAGETMTVAEAIERKNSIRFEKTLLATLIDQAQTNQHQIEIANVQVDVTIERQLTNLFGGDKAKITPENRKEQTDAINAVQRQLPIDPNNIAQLATERLERLSQFETEIDFVLSEINSKTEIEIEDENSTPAPVAELANAA